MMERTIRVNIIKENEWSYFEPIKFKVNIKATPEFMREPEFVISDVEKIEIIAERLKEEFIKIFSDNIL